MKWMVSALAKTPTRWSHPAPDVHELVCPRWNLPFPGIWSGHGLTIQQPPRRRSNWMKSPPVPRCFVHWLSGQSSSVKVLKSRDFLGSTGPASLDEALRGCSTLQKDLLQMLPITPPVHEASFSRFINHCDLVWPTVQFLFKYCSRSKRGWHGWREAWLYSRASIRKFR